MVSATACFRHRAGTVVASSSDLAEALQNPQTNLIIIDPTGVSVFYVLAVSVPALSAGLPGCALADWRRQACAGSSALAAAGAAGAPQCYCSLRYATPAGGVRAGLSAVSAAGLLHVNGHQAWQLPVVLVLRKRQQAALLLAVNGNPTIINFGKLPWVIVIGSSASLEMRDMVTYNYAPRGSATNTSMFYVGGLVSWPSISAQDGGIIRTCAASARVLLTTMLLGLVVDTLSGLTLVWCCVCRYNTTQYFWSSTRYTRSDCQFLGAALPGEEEFVRPSLSQAVGEQNCYSASEICAVRKM